MNVFDIIMLALFVLFLCFMLAGMSKQILKKDEIRRKLKDKK